MSQANVLPPRWQSFIGHAVTVFALSLGGLSSFHSLRGEVVELRATVHALMQTEAEHYRQGDLRELRADLKNQPKKGADKP